MNGLEEIVRRRGGIESLKPNKMLITLLGW